ncbi:SRPBCC family protein [Cellulomonas sp. URHB0016]
MSEQNRTMEKTFTITRVLDAPRAAVWRAWTDPDEMTHWYHPRGLTTPRESVAVDLRPGGEYRYTMVAPDDTAYPTGGVYREVVEPERLVFTWGDPGDDEAPVATVTLDDLGDRTRMTFRLDGVPGAPGDGSYYDGWVSALEVLAEHVA